MKNELYWARRRFYRRHRENIWVAGIVAVCLGFAWALLAAAEMGLVR